MQHCHKVSALDSGADDFLTKPYDLDELLARVRAVMRRGGQRPVERPLVFAGLRLDPAAYEASYNGVALELAGKEFAILALLLRHPRQIISRATFYEQVWDYDFDGGNSIEVYISVLRRKLNRAGAAGLLQTVRGVGYTLREPVAA